jgi:hypothetical protein
VIDFRILVAQNIVDHAIFPAPSQVTGRNDFVAQFGVDRADQVLIAIGVPA